MLQTIPGTHGTCSSQGSLFNTTFDIEHSARVFKKNSERGETQQINYTNSSISSADQMFKLDKHLDVLGGRVVSVTSKINQKG